MNWNPGSAHEHELHDTHPVERRHASSATPPAIQIMAFGYPKQVCKLILGDTKMFENTVKSSDGSGRRGGSAGLMEGTRPYL